MSCMCDENNNVYDAINRKYGHVVYRLRMGLKRPLSDAAYKPKFPGFECSYARMMSSSLKCQNKIAMFVHSNK